jgi:hypothetical protein
LWPSIEIINNTIGSLSATLLLGNEYIAQIDMELGEIDPEEIGIETLIACQGNNGKMLIKEVFEFKLKEYKEGKASYICKIVPDMTGNYRIAGRLYAKNSLLPHRQDFELVKWL